ALTPKIRPTSWRERPASTARTMRSRRSSEKGFAIPAGLQPSIEDEPQLDLIRESPRRFRLFGTRSSENVTPKPDDPQGPLAIREALASLPPGPKVGAG